MKTAEERAEELLKKISGLGFMASVDYTAEAFREVSRDTRHACAESLFTVTHPYGSVFVEIDKAHTAIMNTVVI